jgi:hypothetical protein
VTDHVFGGTLDKFICALCGTSMRPPGQRGGGIDAKAFPTCEEAIEEGKRRLAEDEAREKAYNDRREAFLKEHALGWYWVRWVDRDEEEGEGRKPRGKPWLLELTDAGWEGDDWVGIDDVVIIDGPVQPPEVPDDE